MNDATKPKPSPKRKVSRKAAAALKVQAERTADQINSDTAKVKAAMSRRVPRTKKEIALLAKVDRAIVTDALTRMKHCQIGKNKGARYSLP